MLAVPPRPASRPVRQVRIEEAWQAVVVPRLRVCLRRQAPDDRGAATVRARWMPQVGGVARPGPALLLAGVR